MDRWRVLLETPGVTGLIRSGDKPAIVREAEIERLRAQGTKDRIIILPLTKFQPGQAVRVTRGPLIDRTGLYEGVNGKDRIKVLFSMFEQQVEISLRESDVAAV